MTITVMPRSLQVSDIDGVELAEGSYSTDVMSGEDDARKVLHLESISSNFNCR